MKKFITIFSCAVLFAVGVSAQELAYDKSFAKWSVALKGGIDYYRVDPYATGDFKTHLLGAKYNAYALQASWAAPGLNIEYTINPYFGIGFEAAWLQYNRGTTRDGYTPGVYLGSTIDGLIYGSVNILNLVAPYRRAGWRKVSLYGNLGIGGGCYNYKRPDDEKRSFHGSPLGMASLALEWNVSKTWGLFLEGQYRSYTKEDMGGAVEGGRKSTDALVAFFGVRYKFKGKKATNGHARDLSAPEYEANMAGESNELRDKLKNLEDQVAALNGRTDNLGKDIEDLKNNKADKGDVNGLKDRVKALEEEVKRLKKGETATAALDNIVFETGSSKLTGNSENILTNLVNMLKIHNVSSLEISGHTDNVGGEAYNQRLSEKRAESVKAYLVNAGFDGSKITTSGYGFKKPIADNSTPQGRKKNRRVEISVIK